MSKSATRRKGSSTRRRARAGSRDDSPGKSKPVQAEVVPEDATVEMSKPTRETSPQLERLQTAVAGLRGRAKGLDLERVMLMTGAAVFVLGFLLIVLGWWGAAKSPFLFEQIPYLISGGLLGLGFAFAGGFVYFAYWVTRMVRESREHADRATDALRSIEQALLTSANGSAPSATGAPGAGPGAGSGADGTFVATAKGTMFHRRECTVVAGRKGLRRVKATAKGMTPCGICDPLSD